MTQPVDVPHPANDCLCGHTCCAEHSYRVCRKHRWHTDHHDDYDGHQWRNASRRGDT